MKEYDSWNTPSVRDLLGVQALTVGNLTGYAVLDEVLEELGGIPRPQNAAAEFTWFGDSARTVLAYLVKSGIPYEAYKEGIVWSTSKS